MTQYAYDPDLPIIVAYSTGDKPLARFRNAGNADVYRNLVLSEGVVIDTTPKPKIPEDAQFITWLTPNPTPLDDAIAESELFDRWYAAKHPEGWWIRDDGQDFDTAELSRALRDAEVTVLVPREAGGDSRTKGDR